MLNASFLTLPVRCLPSKPVSTTDAHLIFCSRGRRTPRPDFLARSFLADAGRVWGARNSSDRGPGLNSPVTGLNSSVPRKVRVACALFSLISHRTRAAIGCAHLAAVDAAGSGRAPSERCGSLFLRFVI